MQLGRNLGIVPPHQHECLMKTASFQTMTTQFLIAFVNVLKKIHSKILCCPRSIYKVLLMIVSNVQQLGETIK